MDFDETRLADQNETLRAENDALRDRLARALHALGREIEAAGSGDGMTHAPEEAAVAPVAPVPAPPSAADWQRETAEAIGEACAAWCRAASPLMSRGFMFERTLREAIPDARVVAVYRSGSRFGSLSANGPEYWRVEAGGDAFLLPQPLSREQFRDADALAFEVAGGTRPVALATCRAATLVSDAGTHSVELRGVLR